MRTLEEIIKEYAIECGNPFGVNIVAVDIDGCKEIARRFAKEVAKEALKNASERARLIAKEYDCDCGNKHLDWNINKKSILNESNIPKL